MSDINWLHLSDFHFRTENSPKGKVEDYNREVVLKSLLEDVKTYQAEKKLKFRTPDPGDFKMIPNHRQGEDLSLGKPSQTH